MRVLRQPQVLAQVLARLEMLPGAFKIPALEQDHTQPHVHVSCAAQERAVLTSAQCQEMLEDPHRVAEATLDHPQVRQRDGAPEDVGDVPGLLQLRHPLDVPVVGGCTSPPRHSASAMSDAAAPRPRWSSVGNEVEGPSGEHQRGWYVLVHQGLTGPVHRNQARKASEFLIADVDRVIGCVE